jgi:signal recognition particle receptor subunit beta
MEERSSAAEVNARIVYWGISGAGKRTNLRVIHAKLRPDHRGELRELPTRLDPTVSYALLPIELGEVSGVRTRIQVLTAPSGAEQAPTRKQLLDRADGIVFVADAQRERLSENLACFDELRAALAAYGRPIEQVPLVIQYNKRDLTDPYALEELHRKLGMRGVAAFEAVARDGSAVLQTLTTISKRVIRHRREESARESLAPAPGPIPPAPPPGTTQLLLHATEPEPLAAPPPEPEPEPGHGLDPDLLRAEPEPALEPGGGLAAAFEPSFEQAAELAEPEPAFEPAAAPPSPASLFAAKGLGVPASVDSQTLAVPLRLRDATGRVRQLTLRIRIESIEEERT